MARRIAKSDANADTDECDWPGCRSTATHKAPQSREALNKYYWFCLDHVRQYNKNWNYYAGMSEDEVEADVRRDTVWNRPTWKLGSGPMADLLNGTINDPLDAAGLAGEPGGAPPKSGLHVDRTTQLALDLFGLELPVTEEKIRARYKTLVKRHHPDANRGRKKSEEEFKRVQEAYQTLMNFNAT